MAVTGLCWNHIRHCFVLRPSKNGSESTGSPSNRRRHDSRTTCKQLPLCTQHTKSDLGVEVKDSTIPCSGLGLFALKLLRKGQSIVPCTRGIGGYSNSKPGQNNASLVTNAAAKTVSIRASKNVRPGQEIFTSYGPGYFKKPNDLPKPILLQHW